MLKMLDIGCGKGGVSDGFAMEGFDVTGIDIIDAPALLDYKHRFIQADVTELNGVEYPGFAVIWVSMPCRDVCQMSFVGKGAQRKDGTTFAWKDPPNPNRAVRNIQKALMFVWAAQPTFWIMENSPLLGRYLGMKPRQISYLQLTMRRGFWGNYPDFLMPLEDNKNRKTRKYMIGGKTRSWDRAKIPLSCSRAFAKACKEALTISQKQSTEVTE